jgi:hypothetical protein
VLAAIHRLLRSNHERLRPQIPNLGFDRERHADSLILSRQCKRARTI